METLPLVRQLKAQVTMLGIFKNISSVAIRTSRASPKTSNSSTGRKKDTSPEPLPFLHNECPFLHQCVDTLISTIHLTLMSRGFIWGKHLFVRDGLSVLDNRHNLKTHELLSSPDLPSEGCPCLHFSNVPSSESGLCLAEH